MKESKVEQYVDRIQPEIAYCYNCQPYEEGNPIWIFGDRCDLEVLLDRCEVPMNIRSDVAKNLKCNSCGTQMQRGDEIGLKTKEEKALDRKFKKWRKSYEKPLSQFATFLESYPYLGVKHPLGSTIVNGIKRFPKITISNEDWYRARSITGGKKPIKDDMRAPDPSKVPIPEGRYNHFGQSHWYLANSGVAAAKETLEKDETMVWIQRVHIQKAKDILDVRTLGFPDIRIPVIAMGIIFSGVLKKPVERDRSWKPEYFIPRFIADSAKLAGLKGIIFNSDRHYHSNLVLFEPEALQYKFKGEPYIFDIGARPKDVKSIDNKFGMIEVIDI